MGVWKCWNKLASSPTAAAGPACDPAVHLDQAATKLPFSAASVYSPAILLACRAEHVSQDLDTIPPCTALRRAAPYLQAGLQRPAQLPAGLRQQPANAQHGQGGYPCTFRQGVQRPASLRHATPQEERHATKLMKSMSPPSGRRPASRPACGRPLWCTALSHPGRAAP